MKLPFLISEWADKKGDIFLIGKTERTLRRNVLDIIQREFGSRIFNYALGSKAEASFFGRTIHLAGANDERAYEKIRGSTAAQILIDEGSLIPESFMNECLDRLSLENAQLSITTNPGGPQHYLKKKYIDRINAGEINGTVHTFSLEDNPYLPKQYIEAIKKEHTGIWYKRAIEGLWVIAEGSVYDMFDEKVHVVREGKRQWKEYLVGVDYGTAGVFTIGIYGTNGITETQLIDEIYYDARERQVQKTDREFADMYIDFVSSNIEPLRPVQHYCDPSAVSFMAEMSTRGIGITAANNDVLDGIRFVGTLLKCNHYKINARCTNTIREIQSYVWDEKFQEKGIDKPVKKNDHAMDRDRYALYTRYGANTAGVMLPEMQESTGTIFDFG